MQVERNSDNRDTPPTVAEILKGTDYGLKVFSDADLKAITILDKGGKPYLTCAVSDKARPAKPEEIVRQLYLSKLMSEYGYPKDRITVEKSVQFGSSVHDKAADIVIFEKGAPTTPYIIVECKKPKRKDGLEQLESYCNATGAPVGVWTNGGAVVVRHRKDPNLFDDLTDLPRSDQTLADLLKEPWTLDDLKRENILVNHPRFDEDDLMALPVPDRLRDVSPTIERHVQAAIASRQEAARLLEDAKMIVQKAILGGADT